MDFVSDSLSGGWRLKYLTVADAFNHESVEMALDFGISGHKQCIHGLGASAWNAPHPDPAGAPDAERLHREVQWQVPR